ncbi:MAG: putative sugar nucleotidyl transferase, partial [Fidelibacterota bacterium]
MRICVFEDEEYKNLNPLVHTRPVYNLRCGIS